MLTQTPAQETDEETPTQKRDRINLLFDAMSHEQHLREKDVFERYYQQQAQIALSLFLRDVTTCPQEVIDYCQELLAPKEKAPAV